MAARRKIPATAAPARQCRVVKNVALTADIMQIDLAWDGSRIEPGQFLNVLPPGGASTLRRPLSVADVSDDFSLVTLIYRIVGEGTALLARLGEGSYLDTLGPLGCGFDFDYSRAARALLIGGGVGIPPLYLLGRRLRANGWEVAYQLGLRSGAEVFWADRFAAIGETEFATDDGSFGTAGTVMNLPQAFAGQTPSIVAACGPTPMLRAVKQKWQERVPTYLSLEERMACGTGACYACVIADSEDPTHQYRICFEGPVFRAEEVVI